ncbi:MAG: UvrD-helicase domain-containing protein [Pseudomonadota bacterium]
MSGSIVDQAERHTALDPLRSFCVTAPAGSGKTELLIQRYLSLLARVQNPQAVLAITFTRKAATEMQGRVVAALNAADRELAPDASDHERTTRRLAQAVLATSEREAWSIQRNPAQLNIRTIDSFCGFLTRQLPLLSRFGGSVATVDDASSLYRAATEVLLETVGQESGPGEDLRRLLLVFNNDWRRLGSLLEGMLARRDQWLLALGSTVEPVAAERLVTNSLDALIEDQLNYAQEVLEPWTEVLLPLWQHRCDALGLPATDTWPGTATDDLLLWRSLAQTLLTKDGAPRRSVDKRSGFAASPDSNKAMRKAMLELLEAMAESGDRDVLIEVLNEVLALPVQRPDDQGWQDLLACTRLLPTLAASLNVIFQQRGAVDHMQVALAALESLGPEETPTELSLKLDYQLEHILVDEFQDTAESQFRLIERLSQGWSEHNKSNPQAARTLFIVGDGMQSIYGFRDADVKLFIRAKQYGISGVSLTPMTLRTNFRSRANVVTWCNRVFSAAFPLADDIHRGEIAFSPAVAFEQKSAGSGAEVWRFETPIQEAEWLAEQLALAQAEAPDDTKAVLVRRKADLLPLTESLRKRGLEWDAQDIDRLADSPVVGDLTTLCQALYNPVDRVAWYALLRAPWCGLTLQDLFAVSQFCQGTSLWDALITFAEHGAPGLTQDGGHRLSAFIAALSPVVSQLERYAACDAIEAAWIALRGPMLAGTPRALDDAAAFMRMLSELEQSAEGFSLQRLADAAARLFAENHGATSQIKLMTLHKAKGLEFDQVFMPNLSHAPRGDKPSLLLWEQVFCRSGDSGVLLALAGASAGDSPTVYDYLNRQQRLKRDIETTRLLYVGATRAVKRLILSASLNADGNGGWQPPARSSLLAKIWDEVEGDIMTAALEPDEIDHQDSVEPMPLQRIRADKLPDRGRLTGITSPRTDEANLPEHISPVFSAIGTVIHASLERLSCHPLPERAPDWTGWWESQLLSQGVPPDEVEAAVAEVARQLAVTLADERGRWCLDSGQQQARSEWAVSGVDGQGEMKNYIIDRSFIVDDRCWVIDYKTAMPDPGESTVSFLDRQRDAYRSQLNTYQSLLTSLQNLPVHTALYFTGLAAWLELD